MNEALLRIWHYNGCIYSFLGLAAVLSLLVVSIKGICFTQVFFLLSIVKVPCDCGQHAPLKGLRLRVCDRSRGGR